MDHGSFARVREVFEAALTLAPSERAQYLSKECGRDPETRSAVERLLETESRIDLGGGFLEPRWHDDMPPGLDVPMPGSRLGSYRIDRLLASGGMGTVFEATQDQPKRRVALKVLRASVSSAASERRFRREAEALGRLRHPGIAQIFEAGADGGVSYIAMELAEGASTIVEHARERALDARGRVTLLAAACDAVHHGHQKGVLHRDLKPSNVLVDAHGRVKVIDFGVARVLDPEESAPTIATRAGQILGTVQCMSPEQIQGDAAAIDVRSDVYALGVLLFELLAGRLPFDLDGKPIAEAARIVVSEPPPRLRTLDPRIGAELEWVVEKCLAKEPDRRYGSASDLAADLRAWLDGRAVVAGPPSAAYRFRVFARTHRLGMGVACALVLAIGVGVTGLAVGLHRESTARAEAEREAYQQRILYEFVQEVLSPQSEDVDEGRRLVDRLDTALLRLEEAFVDEPGVAASLRATIGIAYAGIGFPQKAEPALRAGYEQLRVAKGLEDPQTVRAGAQLGRLLVERGKHEEAIPYLRAAAAHCSLDSEDEVLWANSIYHSLARALESLGSWQEAWDIRAERDRRYEAKLGAGAIPTQFSKLGQAMSHLLQHRPTEAEALARRVLETTRTMEDLDFRIIRRRADATRMVALALVMQGRSEEAEAILAPVLEEVQTSLGERDWVARRVRDAWGIVLAVRGRTKEATPLLRASASRVHQAIQPGCLALLYLAQIGQAEGDFPAAKQSLEAALEAIRSAGESRSALAARVLRAHGLLASEAGDRAIAEASLRESAEIYARGLGSSDPVSIDVRAEWEKAKSKL